MKRRTSQNKRASPEAPFLTLRAVCLLALALAGTAVRAGETQDCEPAVADRRIVIIIDDMGHNLKRGRAALELPGKLNYAVIPYTRFGAQLAEQAFASGKEILLHAPMSTVENDPLGRGGLTPDLDRDSFRATLDGALAQVPHVQGINNHMGSDLTQRRPQMAWLMQELRWRELYFVDSRTTENTVAATVAAEFNVPHVSRHVFLDNDRDPAMIDEQFQALLAEAEHSGLAVAIGHPYPETIAYLQEELLTVHDRGFRPVFVSEVVGEAGDCSSPNGIGEESAGDMATAVVPAKAGT